MNDENSPTISLGCTLRFARQKLGLSQERLARKARISRGYLSRIEADIQVPRGPTLLRLFEVLGVDRQAIDTVVPHT